MRAVDFSLLPRNLELGIWPGVLFTIKIIMGSLPFLFLKKLIQIRKSKMRMVMLFLLCEILAPLLRRRHHESSADVSGVCSGGVFLL